ncbi:hypothetical protein [Lentzea sp. NPDC051838]|uniref:hypothetical protein n=1 Tax=Lentzea sp. NPDC051838 TaxID=3154849 RepID=UPI0034254ECD
MKQLRRAAAGIAVVDALIVVASVLPGAPLLPMWMTVVACALTVAVLVLTIVKTGTLRAKGLKELLQRLRNALPVWAIVLIAVAFYGGWIIALVTLASDAYAGNLKHENGQYTSTQRKVVRVLTEEQYLAAQAANQRMFGAGAMAVAAGALALGALRPAAEGSSPRA